MAKFEDWWFKFVAEKAANSKTWAYMPEGELNEFREVAEQAFTEGVLVTLQITKEAMVEVIQNSAGREGVVDDAAEA